MIKLILEITRNNLFKYRKPERSPKKPSRILCQSVLIPRKISGTFYAKFCEKYMEFEENNEEFEGKMTRNLKEKLEGKTQGIFNSGVNLICDYKLLLFEIARKI
jgi:hypothetical protein